jgi:hypothetical protein
MTVLEKWDLRLDVDVVLRSQGADPAAIRKRSPSLVESAERALEEGNPLLQPRVKVRRYLVEDLHHERLKLEGNGRLSGGLLAEHMGGAQEAAIVLCTVGDWRWMVWGRLASRRWQTPHVRFLKRRRLKKIAR